MNLIKKSAIALLASLSLMAAVSTAQAEGLKPDSMALEVGVGENDLTVTRISAQWDWNQNWFNSNGTSLDGYWDLNAAWWHATDWKKKDEDKELAVIGLTPVFRFMSTDKKGFYIEGGIGAAFFSKVYNNSGNNMGISFQFTEHVGVGYVFNNNLDLGVRAQHYSNAGLNSHNSGENLLMLRAAYRF